MPDDPGPSKETRKHQSRRTRGQSQEPAISRKQRTSIRQEVAKRKTAEAREQRTHETIELYQKELQALAGQLIRVQEDERRRISRDLHDETIQQLAMVGFDMDGLRSRLPLPTEEIEKELQRLQSRISDLANEIRQICHQLHPSILEHMGLSRALQTYAEDFENREGIRVRFRSRHLPATIPRDIGMCLYRTAQECFQNVAKYARTDTVEVELVGFARSMRLTIRDYGVGFDPYRMRIRGEGLGFVSMKERIRLVNGQLTIRSRPGEGTQIIARVPLPKGERDEESSRLTG